MKEKEKWSRDWWDTSKVGVKGANNWDNVKWSCYIYTTRGSICGKGIKVWQ